jgi:hypothetical protein
VESSGRGSSTCAQQWRGGGALVVTRERGAYYFICGRARRFAQRHFVDTSTAWARHGGVRARSTAATPLGGRRHGRLGLAKARTTHGARGVGKEGGAALGGPTVRGPTDQGRPRQVCTAAGGVSCVVPTSRHRTRRRTLWRSRGKMFRTSLVPLRFSQDF